MNSKGQESATFEFLVVAIMGLAILVIALGIASYFSQLRFQASWQTFTGGLKSAASSPNGEIIVAKDIVFNTGAISPNDLAKEANLESGCVSIDALSLITALKLDQDTGTLFIKKEVQTIVYFQCDLGAEHAFSSDSVCEKSCLASFGKEIETTPPA